jgi:hypothetical protein
MRTSRKARAVRVLRTRYSNELQNKITVNLVEPVHTTAALADRHEVRDGSRQGQANIQQARIAQQAILQTAVTAGEELKHP